MLATFVLGSVSSHVAEHCSESASLPLTDIRATAIHADANEPDIPHAAADVQESRLSDGGEPPGGPWRLPSSEPATPKPDDDNVDDDDNDDDKPNDAQINGIAPGTANGTAPHTARAAESR